MLDRRLIRENPEIIRDALQKRGYRINLDELIELDRRRRECIEQAQALREQRNALSKQIGQIVRAGGDAEELKQRVAQIRDELERLEREEKEAEEEFERRWIELPNIPHPAVPVGAGPEDNVVVHERGEPRRFDFEAKPHWEIGTRLGILDWETAAKIAGARFVNNIGLGA
ncbi:MAG: serine--tRNA ligase, partial [Armatimonadetes bacterium]|nr:serine--tRNA ligase [Armatimonadota bacterium]